MTEIVLYGKAGCCLCDEARAELAALRGRRAIEVLEVDVSLDPALNRLYGERIPVVEVAGEVVAELRVDARDVEDALAKVGS